MSSVGYTNKQVSMEGSHVIRHVLRFEFQQMLNTDVAILDLVEIKNQTMNGLQRSMLKHDANLICMKVMSCALLLYSWI